MNWKRILLLLIPIRLRQSRLFFLLTWALSSFTRRKYDEQEKYIKNLLTEMSYTSQYKALESLLRKRFSSEVEIVEDEQLDKISIVRKDNSTENTFVPMIVYSDSEVVIQRDFIVKVPAHIDKEKVREFVGRYVFCGIYYDVIYK